MDRAMDLDSLPQMSPSQYCYLCGNGGNLMMCDTCTRAMCYGPDPQCLGDPVNSRYKDPDVIFVCPPCHQDGDRAAKTHTPYYGFYTSHTNKTPIYEYPAEVRGTAQLIPRSKFLSNGVAILNFRFGHFHLDTGDLGKILGPFAAAFFPEEGNGLIYEDIMFDMCNQRGHRTKIRGIARQLGASSTLKTVIILVTTHAEKDTG